MSSFHGSTLSGYEGISPYRLYLDVSMDDRDFVGGAKNPLVYSENSIGMENFNPVRVFKPQPETSTYGMMLGNTSTQLFCKFIETYNLQRQLSGDFTLFVPINNFMNIINDKLQSSRLEPLDIFNYHKLDYVLFPIQLFGKKIRLETKLRNQYILTNDMSIMDDNTGVDSGKIPNRILQSIKSDNGYIYIIEKPLIPYFY